jgi:hypothetical protein
MREHYGSQPVPYGTGGDMLHEGDLLLVDILPYMRPGYVSKQKSILEAQTIYELSRDMPDIVDRRKAAEGYLRAMGKPNIEEFLVPDQEEEEVVPQDPVTEFGMVLAGHPVSTGIAQNHQAHISSHAAQMQMLQSSELPTEAGDAAMALISAHIAEHMAMDVLQVVATRTGIPIEQFGEAMPPEMEAQVAPMIAEAIIELEAERRPPEQQDTSLQVAQVREQGQTTREALKQQHAAELQAMKQRHELELQEKKDEAAMERALEDDATALKIANMKDANKGVAKAGVLSG